MMSEQKTDILIVGGGTGGCAAALAAASMGKKVVLTEETDWIGGQFTSQIVPPDEHQWIEQFGCTRRYRQLRDGVRNYYREHYPLTPAARHDSHLNPGLGSVSRLCHEPRVSVAVLDQMMAFYRSIGLLRILLFRKPASAETAHDRVRAVTFKNLLTAQRETIKATYVLDATELGDLLPMTGAEYVSGAESRDETGEPHAVAGQAQPENVQSFTWCFPMGYDPDGEHVIDKPAQYDQWRNYIPSLNPPWPGKLLDWSYTHPITSKPNPSTLFPDNSARDLWTYRRLRARQNYLSELAPHEITLVNWPQNDYWKGNIIDKPEPEAERYLEESRQLSLSFLYWLQTEAPRPDGEKTGYPGLYLCPEISGTGNGLAKYPYIRESRRIRAVFTVTENHVGIEARNGRSVETFNDSVGIGFYRIDLHPSANGANYIDIASSPFQIPLGALLPVRVENLLPACKNIGTTHITNGCYRLHPVEWNIGEAAGLLAAFVISRQVPPRAVRERPELSEDFQKLLFAQGVETTWPKI
ncbi:MAG: FAD-dependent oxidoreductase [Verrucomicrobia bacterium]|nr:FAD-dependent oxidoreductase [Verrucomicrobiota bacterium]MBU1735095.1 FAD-dependent oxidoreductase [Verrucomicrobiota bacterium]MBU1856389.1 FAD-dependent oxidoreductase [Verrucomicrobiota bacterium]